MPACFCLSNLCIIVVVVVVATVIKGGMGRIRNELIRSYCVLVCALLSGGQRRQILSYQALVLESVILPELSTAHSQQRETDNVQFLNLSVRDDEIN